MYDADRPIQSSSQDRFGRTIFGKYLARCILDQTNTESFTIGLYGESASGKSSIINLTMEELHYASNNMFDQEKPIILNYNAWSDSGQDHFLEFFFKRLNVEFRNAEFLTESEKNQITSLIELYASLYTHQKIMPHSPQSFLAKLFGSETKVPQDVIQVKTELNALLGFEKRKIIIFIDNISRLPMHEMKQIFQLTKSIGDFLNTTYILVFDEKDYESLGQPYLEKIIQLPFHIPPISRQDIENLLLDRLQNVMTLVPPDSWDAEYWGDIYNSTIKHFFVNCRDITRYINILNFSYVHVRDVVNPVDFFAITAIEIFEPNVYLGIRDNKDLFVDIFDTVYTFDKEKLSEDRMRVNEVFSRAEKIPAEMIELLCVRLFPRLLSLYDNYRKFPHTEGVARKYKRISTYDLFDVYFRLSIPSDKITDQELDAFIKLTQDESGFQLALLRLNHDERIPYLLDLLDSYALHRIKKENIPHVIDAFMDSADLFPFGKKDDLHFDTPMRVHRIIHQLLMSYGTSQKRFAILKNAIKKSVNSLYIIVHELNMQSEQHDENENAFVLEAQRDFTADELEVLKKLAVEKIEYWAEIGRLIEHPELIPILFAWEKWGNPDDCKKYIAETVKNDRNLIIFLRAAFKEPIKEAVEKEEMNPAWNSYLNNVESFIPSNFILPHAIQLFEDDYFVKLKEEEQLALLIFLNLVKPDTMKTFGDTI